jgi:general stress protein 26
MVFNKTMSSINNAKIRAYINNNPVAVLGTVDKAGLPHGAAVYVYAAAADKLYMVTKNETAKYKHLQDADAVSVTIVNMAENSTLQAGGRATVVNDAQTVEMVIEKMTYIYAHATDWLPPLAKIRAGAYAVMRIQLSYARLAQYGSAEPGDSHIFTELA